MFKKSVAFLGLILNLNSFAEGIIPLKQCHYVLRDQNNIIRVFEGIDDEKRVACQKAAERCETTLLSMKSYGRNRRNLICEKQSRVERQQDQICAVSLRNRKGEILQNFTGKDFVFTRACQKGNIQCQSELALRHLDGQNPLAYCSTDSIAPAPVVVRENPPVAVVANCEYQFSFRNYRRGYYQSQTKTVSASANDLTFESAKERACSFAFNLCESQRINAGSESRCTFVRNF